MNEQLSDLRADAAAQAEAAAQAKVQEIWKRPGAIQFSWFGEFDPEGRGGGMGAPDPANRRAGHGSKRWYLSDAPNGKRKTCDEGRGFFTARRSPSG